MGKRLILIAAVMAAVVLISDRSVLFGQTRDESDLSENYRCYTTKCTGTANGYDSDGVTPVTCTFVSQDGAEFGFCYSEQAVYCLKKRIDRRVPNIFQTTLCKGTYTDSIGEPRNCYNAFYLCHDTNQ